MRPASFCSRPFPRPRARRASSTRCPVPWRRPRPPCPSPRGNFESSIGTWRGPAGVSLPCILPGNVRAEPGRGALMDRRGRGLSQDGGTYSLAREVEDVLAVVEALDPPVHVVGISYGGLPALEAAARSDRLAAVAIFEPPIRTGEYTFLTESGMAAGRDAGPGQGAGDG